MTMKTGRDAEVDAIVSYNRAVEVANLLMGKLNKPMKGIFPEYYRSLPRRSLRSGKTSIKVTRETVLRNFCMKNFGTGDFHRLAGLYERVYANDSSLQLSLKEFAELIGQPQKGVLKGAPRHCTVWISPWGLKTEYPEMHLVRDMAIAFNEAITLDAEMKVYEGSSWDLVKREENRKLIANLRTRAAFYRRVCVLSCFNLIEAYINGIAWDFAESRDISGLSKNKQDLLTNGQASLLDKLVKVPETVSGKSPGPLNQDSDPLKTFKEIIKPFRDSIVHASPFTAPDRFGGYDKLSKIYELRLETVRCAVELTLSIIERIHQFLDGDSTHPQWIPPRGSDGKFDIDKYI
ncbi:MAG: hypothetical protein AB7I30_12385 [Isosphaeraceae bacterium]